jgi:hypothetical protein
MSVWQGIKFDALRYTLNHPELRAVSTDLDPEHRAFRACFFRNSAGEPLLRYDSGCIFKDIDILDALEPAFLYQRKGRYKEVEMTILDALAYAQKNNLPHMECAGILYRLNNNGVLQNKIGLANWRTSNRKLNSLVLLKWRFHLDDSDVSWSALSVAEVEVLEKNK